MYRNLIISLTAAGGISLSTCADAPSAETATGQQAGEEAVNAEAATNGEAEASSSADNTVQQSQTRSGRREGQDEARSGFADLAEQVRAAAEEGPASEQDWFKVNLGDKAAPHPVWHETVMPGETLTLSAQRAFTVSIDGDTREDMATQHSWTAPDEPGIHEMLVFDDEGRYQQLAVFVLAPVPSGGNAVMEGYRIGSYPQNTPEGLIRLADADDLDIPVSPNFTIGQFICKQQPGHWPKFVMVTDPMLVRIEALIAELNAEGRTEANSFFVMSGFRTPFYNTAIGSARLSRHMYGDAADVFVDVAPENNVMDDINGDGRVTRRDAEFMYDLAAELYRGRDDLPAGGIGAYGSNAVHGPFVHIDGRGRAARWGRHG